MLLSNKAALALGVVTLAAGSAFATPNEDGTFYYDDDESKYANLLASAVYCPEETVRDFSCNVCQDDRLSTFQFHRELRDDVLNIYGFTGVDEEKKLVSAVFRGTQTWSGRNWGLDFYGTPVPWDRDETIQIHEGFQIMYNTIRPQVIDALADLKEKYPPGEYRYLTTGHSLGGALTYLAAFDVEDVAGGNHTAYPSAAPCTGDAKFAALYEELVPDSWRVASGDDPIPVCGSDTFIHAGIEVYYQPWFVDKPIICDGLNDPRCMQANPNPPNAVDHVRYIDEFVSFCRNDGVVGQQFGSNSENLDLVAYLQQVLASFTDDIVSFLGQTARQGWYYTNPSTGKHSMMFPALTAPTLSTEVAAASTSSRVTGQGEGVSTAVVAGAATVAACAALVGAGVYAVKRNQQKLAQNQQKIQEQSV